MKGTLPQQRLLVMSPKPVGEAELTSQRRIALLVPECTHAEIIKCLKDALGPGGYLDIPRHRKL